MSLTAKSDHTQNPTSRNEKSKLRWWYIHTGTLDSCRAVEISASLRLPIHFLVTTIVVVVVFLTIVFLFAALIKCVERDKIVTKLGLLDCGRLKAISIRDGNNRLRVLRNRGRRGSRRSRTRLSFPVGTNNMRKFATFGGTSTLLGKVRAFPDMLFGTVEASCAIAYHGKIATDTFTWPKTNMGERTIFAAAAAVVGEVHAGRCAFRSRLVRKVTGFGAVRTGSLGEWPTEGDLVGVMLIRTSETSAAAA